MMSQKVLELLGIGHKGRERTKEPETIGKPGWIWSEVSGDVSPNPGLMNNELFLIAQELEWKLTKYRATRPWRQRQKKDKGARNARKTWRILTRCDRRRSLDAQRLQRS